MAVRAAREGGKVARARLGHPGYLKWKGRRDVVSEASLEVQEAIVSSVLAEFPDAGILAEEGPEEAPLPLDAEHLWIVDPICGSLNFVQGIPYFGISIALRSEGSIRIGVVYDPCREELFAATTGTAATLNGEQIVVQQISEGADAWSSAIVGTDWPPSGERRERAKRIVGLMVDQVSQCTLMGSPALGICSVGAGRLHAYWHLDLKIWDIAAASLILRRAGGILTDTQGMSWLYSDGGYIASNAVIHNSTLSCIQAVPRLGADADKA
ncbi:MAG: inositol monophosphatase [Gemmatimonadetes bacterium]|nr:inositol monophosphatase [Gemmatimonadota bacterium]